eukprot:TRINITY_DN25917_c0_g1_i1.p1 TRINITY_DN25917_c0_g1~~TRINITY_DN25917_c0_g1_i1.p1  ORF type:complete len:549 (-),score=47.76 TRINITY_DN25917_c0_g1_i1:220-1866(-)
METPRTSYGSTRAPPEEVQGRVAPRPEHYAMETPMETPRTSLGGASAVVDLGPARQVAPRPEYHPMETPRTSVGGSSTVAGDVLAGPAPRPDHYAMETPRTSLGGISAAAGGEPAGPTARPEHHEMETPRTSLGGASSIGGERRPPRMSRVQVLTPRPENHAISTPRTSVGSTVQGQQGQRRRLSLASVGITTSCCSVRCKCSRRTKWALVMGLLVLLFVTIAVVIASIRGNEPSIEPIGSCSTDQIDQGCTPGFCSSMGQCSCRPNYDQLDQFTCAKPLGHLKMSFFVYRARSDKDAHGDEMAGNAKLYSMEGILWYLHSQIVTKSCPRNLNITRIARFKATVFNTKEPFYEWNGQFGPYLTFEEGKCASPECSETFHRYGQVVGCLPWSPYQGGHGYGNTTQAYSFPKAGRCATPDGSETCTWHLEPAGELCLDELEGIDSYEKFCAAGGIEYDQSKDGGSGCAFWDDQDSEVANAGRIAKLQQRFLELAPKVNMPEPLCDSQNAECRYHEHCHNLPGKCCPADDGLMLACCGSNAESATNSMILA